VGVLILDELLDGLRAACSTFPDKRKGGEVVYSMADIGMAGFAPFFMQSESFLAHQRSLEEKPALDVNWLGLTICDAKGKTLYDGAFVTLLPLTRETIVETAACARARWKIENEGFNVLKNNGYHLEHNFGHGKQNLAMLFCAMNLLAFAMHTACDLIEGLWIKAREAKRARKRFFEHIRTITEYLVFPDWSTLMTTLIASKPPPDVEKQIGA